MRWIILSKSLQTGFEDYPEDVVLVMYGDHLPTMGLTVEDVDNKYLFQTQYVMWDNFGLEKRREPCGLSDGGRGSGPCGNP